MLVLSRRVAEQIVISTPAGEVVIALTAIKGNRVAVGILAPREMKIYRGEVLDRIDGKQGAA